MSAGSPCRQQQLPHSLNIIVCYHVTSSGCLAHALNISCSHATRGSFKTGGSCFKRKEQVSLSFLGPIAFIFWPPMFFQYQVPVLLGKCP